MSDSSEYETDDSGEVEVDEPEPAPEPEPEMSPVEWKTKGNEHYKSKEYIKAIECYTKAVDGAPEDPMFLNNRASALIMMLDFKGALADSVKAMGLLPNTVKYMEKAAKCYSSLGRKSDATRLYTQILEVDPANAAALRETAELRQVEQLKKSAEAAAKDGRHNIAISFLGRALDITPADDSLKLMQAEAYLAQDKIGDAERIAANILRKNSNHTEALYVRGLCKYAIGEVDVAIDHFKRALRGDPDHKRSKTKLKQAKDMKKKKAAGTAALKSGRYEEAVGHYTEALEVDPDNKLECAKLYYNRAVVFSKLHRDEEALADCDSALEIDERYVKALCKRVRCMIELEQFEDAVRYAEEASKRVEGDRDLDAVHREAKVELKKSLRKNYYKILGVTKHVAAPELKKAYRKAALKTHPDRCHDESKKEAAEAAFKDVNEAYAILSDESKRQAYDNGADIEEINQGGGGHGHGHGGGFNPDMFSQMFGGRGGGGGGFPGGGGFHFG